jgi:hypothetical protein
MNYNKNRYMNKILFTMAVVLSLGYTACKKADFSDAYSDPSKVSGTTVEKQFAGFLVNIKDYVVPSYWNYFVVLRPTVNRYTQVTGWENASGQYVPGGGLITDRWNAYYSFVAQYRELERVYSQLSADDQAARRIFMLTAAIYFYDQTQKVVDLHGDIPWSQAGTLSTNGGNYNATYAAFDNATAIYTKMLDDLKGFADELNSINVSAAIQTGFKNQDIINQGNLTAWKKYCNSLRIRMLSRVSAASAFQSRASSEIAAILASPSKYPIVSSNADNIQIEIYQVKDENGDDVPNKYINSNNFQSALEAQDWYANIAGKAMIDHMNTNIDPRLPVMFEKGANSGGVYKGLDPSLTSSVQHGLITGGTLSILNRSTFSRNDNFPGVLINASEISFLLSEYYLKTGNTADAQKAYETGITQSIEYYYLLRSVTNDNTAPAVTEPTSASITAYIETPAVNWTGATTTTAKLKLIATQKWIHYSIVQPIEGWSEIRRLDAPTFTFWTDDANAQKQPPVRWYYPSSEATYNTANYQAVKAGDNLSTKIFWDLN